MYKVYGIILTLSVLTGCSGVRVNSVFSPNPEEALKTYKVEEYSLAEISRYSAQSLGKVEASFCRTRPDQPRPTESLLLGNLKYKAQKLGANGIVVMECVDYKINNDCPDFLSCRALVYSVDFDHI
ncbi:hypothetical protein [Shewanella colwelliana]|uniref:hypothetical protein n=1 Tax=Shewanella colwelliana TaxID=23 RepID=UPI0022AFFF18|nr:hypothetical protein [Shewanella colwelliana]MCZ4335795.1 hypothetical protein [Shewanella colwelliana]